MPLYKINISEIENSVNTSLDSTTTINRRVIAIIISKLNGFVHSNGRTYTKIFINNSLIDYFMDSPLFVMPPMGMVGDSVIVGRIMGYNICISYKLDIDEYFIGESERELNILKRNKKITKILQHERLLTN